MTVEIPFPVEVWLPGVPASHQASARTKARWRSRVQDATRTQLPEGHFLSADPIRVTIYCFPDTPMEGDLDNIIKPILDSWTKLIYADDQQVEHIIVRKFEPGRIFSLELMTARLEGALAAEKPGVYLRVDIAAEDMP